MSFLRDLFGSRGWSLDGVTPPWGARPSLHAHVAAHARPGQPGLAPGGDELPDEERGDPGKLRWAPGALDGTFGHHVADQEADDTAREVLAALRAFTEHADDARAAALYAALTRQGALQYVDALLPAVAAEAETLDAERLHAVARWLAEGAADRDAVKAAVALLGVFAGGHDRELLLTLGRHEEFTLYAAVALHNTDPNPERTLWELARTVTGWGRIHVVERLAGTEDEHIRAWMLREGYRNAVMEEYTALICAETGDLVGALRLPNPDHALLRGAGDLLSALISGRDGPVSGIDDYAAGAEAAELYLRHLHAREAELRHVLVLDTLRDFLNEEGEEDGEARPLPPGWPERREALLEMIDAILTRPRWEEKVRAGLEAEDGAELWTAAMAARAFGIDPWDAYFRRVARGAGDPWDWHRLGQTDDAEKLERVLRLGEERIPLDAIATGPADAMGMGPGYEPHTMLDGVLGAVGRLPGRGWPMIAAALRSPSVRNRHSALRALAAWGRHAWPPEAEPALRAAAEGDPNDGVREAAAKLLAGEPPA